MATIEYRCDTCKREITLAENALGMTVLANCIITEGCKGTLYQLSRNQNESRQDFSFPASVSGLNDYTPRRVFFEKNINITSNPWKVTHGLGVAPAVTIYIFDEDTHTHIEATPDDYTLTIVNSNDVEITFTTQRSGIIHCVARSSVPRDIETVTARDALTQVSNNGFMTMAVPSLIDGEDTTGDDLDLTVEIQIPSNPILEANGTFLSDTLSLDSPWFGWDNILIRKRRSFTTKIVNIATVINSAFPSIATIDDVPNGSSFVIKQIKFNAGSLMDIESRLLLLLLASAPYGVNDKSRHEIVDVGVLSDTIGRFFVFDGEVFIDKSNIESTYPRIDVT